ncbi:hypothetical protein HYC85_027867 [Camellia sinensis]|uniref:Pentacotripeptide-repeat region of PRORP domain-containing protein n=1 Tax=Camellia sinensis TaxID=4442 RepID=A0A7J7FXH4_CAMSI|nr:hypothetical protein HYC85_027867 [Camellia sinensis]
MFEIVEPCYLEEEPEFEKEWAFEVSPTMFVVTEADSEKKIDFDEGVHEQYNAVTKKVDAHSITGKSILAIKSQSSTFKDPQAYLLEKLGEQTEEEVAEEVVTRYSLSTLSDLLLELSPHSSVEKEIEIERIIKIVNDHSFLDHPLHPTLLQHIPQSVLSPLLVRNVLGRLFATHSNGLKAFEFFKFSLQHSHFHPSSDAFEKTLHILARMRYFDKAWELMEEIQRTHPSLLTLKSMGIMLSRIAKFQTFEDTLEAFKRMEKNIFVGRKFGTDEFNVLLRAFCTQRQMKEARSVFNRMHPRFSPNTKTMNILLLGFKESGDVTAVELFYHEMVRRGFKPNNVTYNIRIDAYCKKGCFGDGLRLLTEMEGVNCLPTIETITTLIHGAGVAQNIAKARELFEEIPMRNLRADTGAYNALLSSLVRCRDMESATGLMDEMEEKGIGHDNITYHTMFFGLMKSKNLDSVSELFDKMTKKNFVPRREQW